MRVIRVGAPYECLAHGPDGHMLTVHSTLAIRCGSPGPLLDIEIALSRAFDLTTTHISSSTKTRCYKSISNAGKAH